MPCNWRSNLAHMFTHLNGYNTPELSKHRKRSLLNLSGSTLESLASVLFTTCKNLFVVWANEVPTYEHWIVSQKHCILCWLPFLTKKEDEHIACIDIACTTHFKFCLWSLLKHQLDYFHALKNWNSCLGVWEINRSMNMCLSVILCLIQQEHVTTT